MALSLEIVSPEKLLLSRPVEMVVIPAAEGEMGVLENHAPMIVLLRGGTIRLYEGGKVTDQLYVSGGFAEVTPTRVTVLANEATDVSNLSKADGTAKLAAAKAEYDATDKTNVPALDTAMAKMQAAQAMIDAAAA